MQIIRDTYERTRGRYVLDVDEKYRNGLVAYLNEHIINDEDKLDELTDEHIKMILNEDWEDDAELDKDVLMQFWSGESHKYNIAETLFDAINDDIWESDYEICDSETDDFATRIVY